MDSNISDTFSGLLSLVDCDASGEITQSEGDDVEMLGNILVYHRQMAELIGNAMGMDAFQEGRMVGKNVTAICIPKSDGSNMGALFDNKAKIDSVLPLLTEAEH